MVEGGLLAPQDIEALLVDVDVVPRLISGPALRRLCAQVGDSLN